MRPPIDDSAIAILRSKLPEFEDHYLDLLDIYDEDLTPEIVLMELADFVANLVITGGEEMLERCCAAVEDLAAGTADGPELVSYCFLNELPLGSRQAVGSYLGRVSSHLAELMYRGESPADSIVARGDNDETPPGAAAPAS
jgi:hypothetical protein